MKPELRYELKKEAEELYATAMIGKRRGDTNGAVPYARKAIELYERLDIHTLEDAAPTRMRVNGVELPDIMHQDVVKQRLGIE